MTLPTGNVTFLFTDIEGSSRLWENNLSGMSTALALHDSILREEVALNHGVVFKTIGDAFCVVFNEAPAALFAASAAQRRLAEAAWDKVDPLKVRMAIHTGVAQLRDEDYFGPVMNRVARILAAGHGRQTLISHATEELVHDRLPAGATLRDLGENRLKDLARPERIYEMVISGLEFKFPPLRSLESFPNNLPVQLTSFIGRESELAEVHQRLVAHRLLTLTGPGGTGKTRLSLQVAAELVEQFPDGVWLVELALETEGGNVASNIAKIVGLRLDDEEPAETALLSFARRKKLLLILDNCEHLIEPVASLAEKLLRSSTELRILASSRTPLGIAGEMTWPVPPLRGPQMSRWGELVRYSLEDLGQFESVRLFLERATAAVPNFRLTEENAPAIARICYRLDGIALALELAAARVRVLPPEQIAERLQDRFNFLTGGSRTALPRQQTLRALIDWSYDLLSEKERILFRRLPVFAGGRTLQAIEAVCACGLIEAWEILDLLTQLLDKSLVSIEEGPTGEPRYVLTESIWQYASSKLDESKEAPEICLKHLAYFRQVGEEAAPHLRGPDQARWLEKLASDRINFRFALEFAAKDPARAEEGLRLAVALTRYWEVRSDLKEGRTHLRALLAVADSQPRPLLAHALGCAGRLAWCQDANSTARDLSIQVTEMLLALGDDAAAAEYIGMRGFVERLENHPDIAEKCFRDCLAIAEKYGDQRIIALGSSGLGSIAADRGDFPLAYRLKTESLELFRRLGDRYLVGLNSWSIGSIALRAGKLDGAEKYFRECIEISLELANRWIIPHLLEGAGNLARLRGNFEQGLTLLASASVMRERLGLDFAPLDLQTYQENLASFRENLGEAVYDRVWTAGQKMRPPAAVELAYPGVKL